MWIFGLNPVIEALRGKRKVKCIYLSSSRKKRTDELNELAQERNVKVKTIHDKQFFDRRFPKGHQGIAAETEANYGISLYELLEIPASRGEDAFFVILDSIEDPRNLGAIARSAEAAGAHGMIIQERRAAKPGAEAAKASAGALEHLLVSIVPNVKNAVDIMQKDGIRIIGAEAGPHPTPWEIDMTGPIAVVIGSEGSGIRRVMRDRCDQLVGLPIKGHVTSLNASVAAGILLYERVRQSST